VTPVKYEDFHIVISPDSRTENRWLVNLQRCPEDEYQGFHGDLVCAVTPADLSWLRNPTAPADLIELRKLGQAVLNTIMCEKMQHGFARCLERAQLGGDGVRLIVSITGEGELLPGLGSHELPIEAAFHNQLNGFIATDERTPISRGIDAAQGQDARKLDPPLRILAIVSEPSDMPRAEEGTERQALMDALKPLLDIEAVKLHFCEPATLKVLGTKLKAGYHVVHFIGHGDFEAVGTDPKPQPHLYFETEQGKSDPADVEQIYQELRNGNVPLAVFTACSSAASANRNGRYSVRAFESLAQTLVERKFGPSAVIGMQLDFESKAAVAFTRAFYTRLLTPGMPVDKAVSAGRAELVREFGSGHRSWVAPVLYSRCRYGRVFEMATPVIPFSDKEREELISIDSLEDVYCSCLEEAWHKPEEERSGCARLAAEWRAKIEEFAGERERIFGNAVTLRSGCVDASGMVECVLTLRLRLASTVGRIIARIKDDDAGFELLELVPGEHVPEESVFLGATRRAGTRVLIVEGAERPLGTHQLARLRLRLKEPLSRPLYRIPVTGATVRLNGADEQFPTVDAMVFAPWPCAS
jgi:hypothetical protein